MGCCYSLAWRWILFEEERGGLRAELVAEFAVEEAGLRQNLVALWKNVDDLDCIDWQAGIW